MKKSLTLILMFLFAIQVFSQEILIQGTIIDKKTRESLPGANIFLPSDWKIGSTADEQGLFKLKISKRFIHDTLVVSFIGYREKHISVSEFINQAVTVELESFAKLMGETKITARRIIAEEFTVKQIKQLDIYLNPASKADPLLAINAMPSSTTTDESASISLRGSRPDETGIYLNDVPIYDAIRFSQLNGIGTFSIFNTSIIERMYVFAGNPPLEYGNASSGLICLQSNNQIPSDPSNTVSVSMANIGALTSRKLNDKTGLVTFANYQPSQILTGLNQDALQNLKSFNSFDLGFHIIHKFNSKNRFIIFNYSNLEGYKFKMRTPSYTGIFDMNKKRNFTIANFISQQNKSEITVNAGYNTSNESYKYSITNIEVDKQDIFFSSAYQHFFEKWSIKSGGSADYRINFSKGTKPLYYYARGMNQPYISINSNQEYFLPELFVYTKFNITDHLIFGTGVRKNIVINHTPNYWSYQGNLNYKINNKNNFILSVGHYNRLSMPNAEQYEITHFQSTQYSLDYTFTSDYLELQTSLFNKNIDHANYNDQVTGCEFYSKINIKPVEFQFSFTSINAEINDGSQKYPSQYDLNYFIRSVLKYKVKDLFEISAIYIFRQGSYYLPVNGSYLDMETNSYAPTYSNWDHAKRLPDYHKVDLSISKYWVPNSRLAVVIFASVSNLLNNKNVRMVNYNSDYSLNFNELYSQRTFYFGTSLMF